MGKIKRSLLCLLVLLMVMPLASCGNAGITMVEREFFAMNTYMLLRADGERAEAALAAAETTVAEIEKALEWS